MGKFSYSHEVWKAENRPSLTFARYEAFYACIFAFLTVSILLAFYKEFAEICNFVVGSFRGEAAMSPSILLDAVIAIAYVFVALAAALSAYRCIRCMKIYVLAKKALNGHSDDEIGICDLVDATSFEEVPGKGLSWRALRSLLQNEQRVSDFAGVVADQGMLSLCMRSQLTSGLFGKIPQSAFAKGYSALEEHRTTLGAELTDLARIAEAEGIRYVVVSGFATEWFAYSKGERCDVGPLDVLVHPDDVSLAQNAVLLMGYCRADSLSDDVSTVYQKKNGLIITLQSCLFGFPVGSTKEILEAHVRDAGEYKTTDAVMSFLAMIAYACRGAESIRGTSLARSSMLSDFYGIKLVFDTERSEEYWHDVRAEITAYGIERNWSVVRRDYESLYGKAAIPVALRDIPAAPVQKGNDIFARLSFSNSMESLSTCV